MPPEKPHWAHLYQEVVTSGLCTGCAGCVIACPHDVLQYDDTGGVYRPWKVDEDGGPIDCTHGVKGCTMCTRACPRFRNWETEIDSYERVGHLLSIWKSKARKALKHSRRGAR